VSFILSSFIFFKLVTIRYLIFEIGCMCGSLLLYYLNHLISLLGKLGYSFIIFFIVFNYLIFEIVCKFGFLLAMVFMIVTINYLIFELECKMGCSFIIFSMVITIILLIPGIERKFVALFHHLQVS
jgi:hypothetical protein